MEKKQINNADIRNWSHFLPVWTILIIVITCSIFLCGVCVGSRTVWGRNFNNTAIQNPGAINDNNEELNTNLLESNESIEVKV